METPSNDYHISFFKPTTPQAKANRNMVVRLVLIWAFAIFGFHIVLRVIEKPTPEPAYTAFENVWTTIADGSASAEDLQIFGQSTLSVLGKISLATDDKAALNNGLSWAVYELTSDSLQSDLVTRVQSFEKIKAEITNISDTDYIAAKVQLSAEMSPVIGLDNLDIRSKILPLELVSANMEALTEDTKANLPAVMGKYLIHNQSFLTDFKFLGFPFHYFYSAVFLLVLFVGLCWRYCVKIDTLNAKFDIVD